MLICITCNLLATHH